MLGVQGTPANGSLEPVLCPQYDSTAAGTSQRYCWIPVAQMRCDHGKGTLCRRNPAIRAMHIG